MLESHIRERYQRNRNTELEADLIRVLLAQFERSRWICELAISGLKSTDPFV